VTIPGDLAYLRGQRQELLRFAARSRLDRGFGWLDNFGAVDPEGPVELWITSRMTHVFSLATMVGDPQQPGGPSAQDLRALAGHGISAVRTSFADTDFDGWFPSVDARTVPVATDKTAYGHAFAILAASSGCAAGIAGAEELLADALDVSARHFWDEEVGLVVDEWDRTWTRLASYRGINANMHSVEAYLAAADVTGQTLWRERALRIVERVCGWAREHAWRIPEHFDADWQPLLEFNADVPADPFRPYGATVGHGLEWARLFVAASLRCDPETRARLVDSAVALTDRAVEDGWARDGADGFVYTTDWEGHPVIRNRMHWVLAEALNTAWVLDQALGASRFQPWRERWWRYADRCFVDHVGGSWHHELDDKNQPVESTWHGKPDIYHSYQAALIPTVPIAGSLAAAVARERGGEVPPADC
jgi:sulfoquinovose isomerase